MSENDRLPHRKLRANIHRTQTGCLTCRSRRVKCSEQKPICAQCSKKQRRCEWAGSAAPKRVSFPRRPSSTACIACREKKLKCIGISQETCERCRTLGLSCVRSKEAFRLGSENFLGPVSQAFDDTSQSSSNKPSIDATRIGELPDSPELDQLIDLYFNSIHHFGLYCFIHQPRFKRLLSEGKAPRELTLMMIASATRFGGQVSDDSLARADAWADAALNVLLPHMFQGFGVIQLMTLLLAQHYDLHRGNFTSAWLLGANCTRMMQMMSLQSFDRTYPAIRGAANNHNLSSPLLSAEALRRVAWCTFYADAMIDGGRYGGNTVDEKAYRLQLPCEQASFLSDEAVTTEPLYLESSSAHDFMQTQNKNMVSAPLDMSAYLLRTAAARRRALYFAFRASHHEQPAAQMAAELRTLEADMEGVIADLPKRFNFNSDSLFIYGDRLTTFITLHVLRHNLFIILGRAALSIYNQSDDPERVNQIRRKRIARALPIAGMVAEGLKAGVVFDMDIGIQAYVALEILLFEPHRLRNVDASIDSKAPELVEAVTNLIAVIRQLAGRSQVIKQMHVEAVHRLLRFEYTHLLEQTDIAALHSKYRFVCQDPAEFDFRDFRWAKMERLRRGGDSAKSSSAMNMNGNEAEDESLLEYKVSRNNNNNTTAAAPLATAATAATPSPRLDAIDINSSAAWHSATSTREGLQDGTTASENASHVQQLGNHRAGDEGLEFTLDSYWPWWPLEQSSTNIDDPNEQGPLTFWGQEN